MTTTPARTSTKSNCGHTMQLDFDLAAQGPRHLEQTAAQTVHLSSTANSGSLTAVIHLAVGLVDYTGLNLVSTGHKKRVVIHHPLTY